MEDNQFNESNQTTTTISLQELTTINYSGYFSLTEPIERELEQEKEGTIINAKTLSSHPDSGDSYYHCPFDGIKIYINQVSTLSSPTKSDTSSSDSEDNSSSSSSKVAQFVVEKEKENLQCSICFRTFFKKWHLTHHTNYFHGDNRPFKCNTCGYRFPTEFALDEHVKKHKGNKRNVDADQNEKSQDDVDEEKPFLCEKCGMRFNYNYSLNRHLQRKNDCSKNKKDVLAFLDLDSPSPISTHQLPPESPPRVNEQKKDLNVIVEKIVKGKLLFVCRVCSRSFGKRNYVVQHVRAKHGEKKSFKCPKCGKFFTTQTQCDRHFEKHAGSKIHKCAVCLKSYNYKSDLVRHLREHAGENLFCCEECKKPFSREDHLKNHILKHKGQRIRAIVSKQLKEKMEILKNKVRASKKKK